MIVIFYLLISNEHIVRISAHTFSQNLQVRNQGFKRESIHWILNQNFNFTELRFFLDSTQH